MKNPKNNRIYQTDCANTKGMLRIIQSIPSPKAEPFKQWLAQVGYERTQEIADPSLAWERARELYKKKGYDDKWIDARLQTKEGRKQLTDEWEQRGIEKGIEYAILTNEIHKGTFNLTTKQHKNIKGLNRENLRDYMSPIELALTTLGKVTTTDMARLNDAQGFEENKKAAQAGGEVAGGARKAYELQTGKKAVSGKYLPGKEDAAELDEGDSAEPDNDT